MSETCEHRNCDRDARAVYEGVKPPGITIRYFACKEHAPEDVLPVHSLQEAA